MSAITWPKHPVIYEINTWVWLEELSEQYGRAVTLRDIPQETWEDLDALHADAVWLMGVWERSPIGRRIARAQEGLKAEFRRVLPDFTQDDNVGSPYCVRRYAADPHLGGPEGLAAARRELARRGLRLILDFVPNHVAPDHPWVAARPDFFIPATVQDLARAPEEFFGIDGAVFARARDPYFPPWQDVLQLNAFQPEMRRAAVQTLEEIAGQCDGVRCDMAMLLISRVFEQTWGVRAGSAPSTEYWRDVIGSLRASHPDFLFMAEAYWDLEWELMQQGFDYCYDKRLYDRLEHDFAEQVRLHLSADQGYQDHLVRFIENHDEPRAATTFPDGRNRAVIVTILTLPGATLLHEGQIEGRRVRLPVQLRRRPRETPDRELQSFYQRLLAAIDTPAIRDGEWRLCERHGWPDNQSCMNLIAWCWRKAKERRLVVVNLSECRSQARVRIPWDDVAGGSWRLVDPLAGRVYERNGDEMHDPGLYVDLAGWGFHFFAIKSSL